MVSPSFDIYWIISYKDEKRVIHLYIARYFIAQSLAEIAYDLISHQISEQSDI